MATVPTPSKTNVFNSTERLSLASVFHRHKYPGAYQRKSAATIFTLLIGTILALFTFPLNAQTIEVLHSFSAGTNGLNPRSSLILGSNGVFYGVAENGGAFGLGSVFKVTTNGDLATLLSFAGTNGANPRGGLVFGPGGDLFGTTYRGGSKGYGVIFRINSNGVAKVIYNFDSNNGANPYAELMVGPDGALYGTTTSGSSSTANGTAFRLSFSGSFALVSSIANFSSSSGPPVAGLVTGADGNLYGAVSMGTLGSANGTIFRVRTNGNLSTLFSFGLTNGSYPHTTLCSGQDGALYGTTLLGGKGYGTVFRFLTNGSLTPIVIFDGTNGASPSGKLVMGNDGTIYGTTMYGGTFGNGTAFRVTTNGNLTTLHSFQGDAGAFPLAGLTFGDDGHLYGTTYNGVFFQLTANGVYTNLASFTGEDGANPYGTLLMTNGILYGTTKEGGLYGNGTAFSVTTNGEFKLLSSFAGTNGANPFSELIAGPDGYLYGTAYSGGATPLGIGVVYRMNTNGVTTTVATFTGTNGAHPRGGVIPGIDARLYGTTELGGASNRGTIFVTTTNGAITSLASIGKNGASGDYPQGTLAWGPDGRLYGTASSSSCFSISTNGNFVSISLTRYAASFHAGLIRVGNTLYGTADSPIGAPYTGEIIEVETNTFGYSIAHFSTGLGRSPRSPLSLGPDNNLYGTAFNGGTYGYGTIFRAQTNGGLAAILSFDGTNGREPNSGVTIGTDGYLYGTTTVGGAYNAGVVYRVKARPAIVTQPTNLTVVAGSTISLTVVPNGLSPFTFQWLCNGTNIFDQNNISGTTTNTLTLTAASEADSGLYSAIVSNAFGVVTTIPVNITVISPPTIIHDDTFGLGSDGFGFSISSSLGSVIIIESSSNLVNWLPLATMTNDLGTIRFVTSETNQASQFYRAVKRTVVVGP